MQGARLPHALHATKFCADCGHVVATHWHKFVSGATRRWVMECALCGRGADERGALAAAAAAASAAAPAAARPAAAAFPTESALLARASARAPPASDSSDGGWDDADAAG